MKSIIKTIYTYLFNWSKIIRFKSFGRNSFIGRCLTFHNSGEGVRIGQNVRIGNDARLSCYKAEGHTACIDIKDGVYMGNNISILTADKVIIEENVLMASYISILGENHGMNPQCGIRYGNQPLTAGVVHIKQNVWIGQNVVIVAGKGISIGEWCVVGAGSVVTKSIPDYCIAVGNPARVIKQFNFDTGKWEEL